MASQNWTLTPSGYCYPDDAPAEGFQLPLKSTPPSPVPVRVVSFLSTLTQQEVSVWDSQTPDTAQLVSKLDETRISQAFLTAVTSTGQWGWLHVPVDHESGRVGFNTIWVLPMGGVVNC